MGIVHFYPGPRDAPPPWLSTCAVNGRDKDEETPAAEEDGST